MVQQAQGICYDYTPILTKLLNWHNGSRIYTLWVCKVILIWQLKKQKLLDVR